MKEREPSDQDVEWYVVPILVLVHLAIGLLLLVLGPHVPLISK